MIPPGRSGRGATARAAADIKPNEWFAKTVTEYLAYSVKTGINCRLEGKGAANARDGGVELPAAALPNAF
jgi:hypothetical protein